MMKIKYQLVVILALMLCMPLGVFAQEEQTPSTQTNVKLKSSSNSALDMNADSKVNIQDVALVIADLNGNLPKGDYKVDVNNDGVVSKTDIQILVEKILGIATTIPSGGSNTDPDAPGEASSKGTVITND